jgi:hypothetical protein
MEDPMPYQHCPRCRLTVHLADGEPEGGPCPRCGETLAGEPRSLFAVPPVRARRSARTPSAALTPEAVRTVLARRGGRWRRDAAPPPGRPAVR